MAARSYNQIDTETVLLKYSYNHSYYSITQFIFITNIQYLSQMRQDARLILFYKIMNSLVQVPFEGVLIEEYKCTRRKHNMKFKQIGHTTRQYGQSYFSKTIRTWNGLAFAEAPPLAVFRSKFASLPHNTIEGSCENRNRSPSTTILYTCVHK